MKGKAKMILFVIIIYLILFFDFEATYQCGKITHKIEYNGIVWIALDYCTIVKYHSDDKPMSFVKYSKTENHARK